MNQQIIYSIPSDLNNSIRAGKITQFAFAVCHFTLVADTLYSSPDKTHFLLYPSPPGIFNISFHLKRVKFPGIYCYI